MLRADCRPLQACCGCSCSPCVKDLWQEEVQLWKDGKQLLGEHEAALKEAQAAEAAAQAASDAAAADQSKCVVYFEHAFGARTDADILHIAICSRSLWSHRADLLSLLITSCFTCAGSPRRYVSAMIATPIGAEVCITKS